VTDARPRAPRVAIIGTRGYPSYYGGFETAVRKLAPYLADEGWDVTVYGRRGSTRDDDPELDPRITRVTQHAISTKSLSTLSHGLLAALHAGRRKPDAALVMNVANGYWLPILKLRGIPTVVNVDGMEWERAKWGRMGKWVFRQGARLTVRFADALVFDAKAIEARWMELFGRSGTFIPYGGDLTPELPVEPGLVSGEYVLVVARLVPENSIPEFVEAARWLARSHPVVIVGTANGGELDAVVARLEQTTPGVRWLGQVSDDRRLAALWQHAGAYFHGHSVGGTNPALVQAMASGTAIVARDTVFNREVLGEAAIFVDAEPVAIAEAIDGLLRDSDRRAELKERAKARGAAEYTWQRVNAQYEKLLRAPR
jgi:glycosyltransferase involved in cell wall biosynthesis